MKTSEIETAMILQELDSFICKVEELNILIRGYAKALLSREHDITQRMESEGDRHEG
jgi:hypothetical protein